MIKKTSLIREVVVAARSFDKKNYGIQKYSNDAGWNRKGGLAPNGVSATRYLRKTSPEIEKLSPLAKWLFLNCPDSVAGNMPNHDFKKRIRVYNGKTEADMVREDALKGKSVSNPWVKSVDEAKENAENEIRCYDLENKLCRINDWHFRIISEKETDTDYWNKEAQLMIEAGAKSVVVGDAKHNVL